MEDLKIKINAALEDLAQRFDQLIDEADTLENIISWNEPDEILDKLDEDDVAEWLDNQGGWTIVESNDKGALRELYEDLKDRFEDGLGELTASASALPWKKDCVTKINELANRLGWQELLTKLENL